MKLLGAPRQPFVGLALMAAVGIIAAELVPVGPTAHFSSGISRNLHPDCALLAEIGCDISHRRGWFFSAAQIRDNEHCRPATRGQTWRAAPRPHSSRMRDHRAEDRAERIRNIPAQAEIN